LIIEPWILPGLNIYLLDYFILPGFMLAVNNQSKGKESKNDEEDTHKLVGFVT
jgi:hypothetical protein